MIHCNSQVRVSGMGGGVNDSLGVMMVMLMADDKDDQIDVAWNSQDIGIIIYNAPYCKSWYCDHSLFVVTVIELYFFLLFSLKKMSSVLERVSIEDPGKRCSSSSMFFLHYWLVIIIARMWMCVWIVIDWHKYNSIF